MIVLDTNVISELMREKPHSAVINWISAHPATDLALTTITIAEIKRGLTRLPEGKRRRLLERNFSAFVTDAFDGRILPFDEAAAHWFGEIAAKREQTGFNTDAVDLMIAAVVRAHDAAVATRNTHDFEGCGIEVINPWTVNG